MFDFNELNSPVSFCGGGGGDGGGGMDAIDGKMNSDNSATQQSYDNAMGNSGAWSEMDTRTHAASEINQDVNGWPGSPDIGGCTGCHDGAYDTGR